MKLYLSSFDIGNQPQKLVDLVSPGKNVLVILNALDNNIEARSRFLKSQTQALSELPENIGVSAKKRLKEFLEGLREIKGEW
jgi:hypothetical protein